jgi:hypothetical protein
MYWIFWLPTIYFSLGFIRAIQLFYEITATIQGRRNIDENYEVLERTIQEHKLLKCPPKDWLITASCLLAFFFWLPATVFNLTKKRYE